MYALCKIRNAAMDEWHDYTPYIKRGGFTYSRNDLDSEQTKRTKDGTLRRKKITEKLKFPFTIRSIPREILAQLDTDLRQETFEFIYYGIHGEGQSVFYCSSFEVTLEEVTQDGKSELWNETTFNVTEC